MNSQLEAILQQRLHHEADLIFRRAARELCAYEKVIGFDPSGLMREHRFFLLVRGHDLIGEFDEDLEGKVGDKEPSGRHRSVFVVEHDVRLQERAWFGWMDRSQSKDIWPPRGLPGGRLGRRCCAGAGVCEFASAEARKRAPWR